VDNNLRFLEKIPYPPLALAAIFLGLAPFKPRPHFVEKIQLLFAGQLSRPIDILDLFFHLAPFFVLLLKVAHDLFAARANTNKDNK